MTEALTNIASFTTTAMGIITGEPVLMAGFCGGLIGIGFRIISQARRATGVK